MKRGENLKTWRANLTPEQKAFYDKRRTDKSTIYFKNNPDALKLRNEAIKANHVGSTGKHWKYPWDKLKFKGTDKAYSQLHNWVRKTFGKATKCEHCGKEATGKQMNWANKSQEYKKDKEDWMQLCPSCHAFYDLNFVRTL